MRDNQGDKLYDIVSPHELGLGMRVCSAEDVFLPINLPSDLDVQIRIGRRDAAGQELPEQIIEVKRTIGCKAVPGAQEGEDALGPYKAGALPFAKMFNNMVQEKFVRLLGATPRDDGKIAQTSFAFLQQMEAGRRIRFTDDQVRDPYDTVETARPVLETKPIQGMVTSVYWFLGLMVRLGTQADLTSLRSIDRLDIALRDALPEDYGLVPFPDTQGGQESAYEYFQKVGKDFAHTLTTELISHEDRIYVSPGFRNFVLIDPPIEADTTLWVMESAGRQTRTTIDHDEYGGLCRLAAIEIRPALSMPDAREGERPPQPEIGKSLSVMPGLYVTGTLKRYRRFPDVPGATGTPLRVTVMTFEPDTAIAAELSKLRENIGDAGLRSLLAGDIPGWRLELLHAGVLPWDGPHPVYRMLAIPNGTATRGESLMCQAKNAAFFLPALASALPMNKVERERHIWDPRTWGNVDSPRSLEQKWEDIAGAAWKNVRVNALQVSGITDAGSASAHAMMLDEFDLSAAESPLRLEKVLGVTALSPRMEAICAIDSLATNDPRNFDPLRDYEDDFINLNTVRVWRQDVSAPSGETQLDEALLRSPQQTEASPQQYRVAGAQRRQTIPLLHSWPTDPLAREEFVKLKDEDAAQVKLTWQMVRDDIARRYGLLSEADKGPYRIDLEHTYGDRLNVTDGISPLTFDRSTRRSWPVALPTFVEAKDQTDKAKPFIHCRFIPGGLRDVVELQFDINFLTFPDLTVFEARKDKRYALTVSAWKAIAELASPGAQLNLYVWPATFDVLNAFQGQGRSVDPAEIAARQGFVGGWASGIGESAAIRILGGSDLDAIRTWAQNWIAGIAAPGKFPIRLGAGDKPGDTAHLIRVNIEIVRTDGTAPVPAAQQKLSPITQQPGLFRVGTETMLGAWNRLGFSVDLVALDESTTSPVWPQLCDARKLWTDERTHSSDSITPEAPEQLPAVTRAVASDPQYGEERKKREAQGALIAALEGSDWFAPVGAGPRQKRLAVEPVHVPIGFAPCQPHVTLKHQTQDALQRLMTALRDTIDLAYPSWTTLSKTEWQTRFDAIAALGQEAAPGRPAGLLVAIVELLVGHLLFAQPDGQDQGNAQKVRELVTALNGTNGVPTGDLIWLAAAVRRRLLADPAMFTNAKALLLTTLNFVTDNSVGPQPPATALGRARFNRKGIDPEHEQRPSAELVTLDSLVFAGKSADAPIEERLAFLETLDDGRYGNRFEVPVTTDPEEPLDYVVESYEELIDPRADKGGWPQRPAVLPLDAANEGRIDRIVHLASRALVSAPTLRWTGESKELGPALAGGSGEWSIEMLEKGRPGVPGTGAHRLRIAASYPSSSGQPVAPNTIERGTSFVLYSVTGDEEQPTEFEKSFENDSFLIRLIESDYDREAQPSPVAMASEGLAVEVLLREMLFAPEGSDVAAEAIRKLALEGTDYSKDLATIVAAADARLPESNYALVRLVNRGGVWKLEIGGPDAQATIKVIRHIALFKPDKASDTGAARTAYLLVGFETSVWAPIDAELCHGRNLPQDRWLGAAAALDAPRFAPQFWQSILQDAPASRHSLDRRARKNAPKHWKDRPTHVIKLKSEWRDLKTPRELVEFLLFKAGHAVGDDQTTPSILSAASRARIFDQQLSIQIAHEQFGEEPSQFAEPLGSFPLEENLLVARKPQSEPAARKWFDSLYDQFSVSLRWFAPSGTTLLSIERIYVEFT
ncbi:MAG: hypothetical protein E6Q50_09240 [Lysobacter sp.]|nr:MAG: hypothetical protein E6Q50_09240 [Lysobacter sp.]